MYITHMYKYNIICDSQNGRGPQSVPSTPPESLTPSVLPIYYYY